VAHRRHSFERRRQRDISDTEMDVPALPLNTREAGMAFNSAEFRALTNSERVATCSACAADAERFARTADLALPRRWSELADEMEAQSA
jgi:hypothetical protein